MDLSVTTSSYQRPWWFRGCPVADTTTLSEPVVARQEIRPRRGARRPYQPFMGCRSPRRPVFKVEVDSARRLRGREWRHEQPAVPDGTVDSSLAHRAGGPASGPFCSVCCPPARRLGSECSPLVDGLFASRAVQIHRPCPGTTSRDGSIVERVASLHQESHARVPAGLP